MNTVRKPYYGGVVYHDPDTGKISEASYPTDETEMSAFMNGRLQVIRDELEIWPPQQREEES